MAQKITPLQQANSGSVTTYPNPGTAGGTFYYVNLGGIKMLWGETGSLGNTSVAVAGGLTLPASFFTTIQSVTATATESSGTANQYASVDTVSTTSIRVIVTPTTGTATVLAYVMVIGT